MALPFSGSVDFEQKVAFNWCAGRQIIAGPSCEASVWFVMNDREKSIVDKQRRITRFQLLFWGYNNWVGYF